MRASSKLDEKREYLRLLTEKANRVRRRKLFTYYPDEGPLRRELYRRHVQFFTAGKEHEERLMLAGNRIGKTEGVGGFELTLHLTGRYPEWWPGHCFERPVRTWACGTTNETVRDILQAKLLGPVEDRGTGLVPGDDLDRVRPKAGTADFVDSVRVRHVSGGWSVLKFKSYEQGRKSFEGTEQDVILLDEEPPMAIYAECVTRTMATRPGERGGMILCTFTPLQGMSEVVLHYLPEGILPGDDPAEASE